MRWLRVAASFVQRGCEESAWNNLVGSAAVERLQDVLIRLSNDDPVEGVWSVSPTEVLNIWCDASTIACGAGLEKGNEVMEDGAWL